MSDTHTQSQRERVREIQRKPERERDSQRASERRGEGEERKPQGTMHKALTRSTKRTSTSPEVS